MSFQKSKPLIQVVGFILLVPLYHLWSLMRYPAPFVDEAWQGARSWGLITTGQAFGVLDMGILDQYAGYWTFYPKIPTILFSLGLRLFNEPNLIGSRLVSFVGGLVLLAAVYYIAKSVTDSSVAKLSLLITSFSLSFLYSSHLGRKDIFTAVFGIWAIALYLGNNSKDIWKAFFSGLLIGLAFETHANGAIYFPVIFWLIYNDYGLGFFRQKHLWSMAIGGSLGLFYYLSQHVFPYPESFYEMNQLVYTRTHTPPLLTFDFEIILKGGIDVIQQLMNSQILIIAFFPLIIWEAVKVTDYRQRRFLTLLAVLLLSYGLLVRNKVPFYAILITPFVDIAIAIAVLKLYKKLDKGIVSIFARGFILSTFFISLLINVIFISKNRYENYSEVITSLENVILDNDTIMGTQTYWLEFNENQYLSWENLIYFQRLEKENDLEQAFTYFRPDILIIDKHWRQFIYSTTESNEYFKKLGIPEKELYTFLTNVEAQLISTIEDEIYGPVNVYRIRW